MTETNFFIQAQTLTLRQVADMAKAALPASADGEFVLKGVAPLESAGPHDLAYMDNAAYGAALGATRAGAVPGDPALCRQGPGRDASPW